MATAASRDIKEFVFEWEEKIVQVKWCAEKSGL